MSEQPGIELAADNYDVTRLKKLPIGCLLWMLALLLFFGILVIIIVVYRSAGPPARPNNADATTSPSASPSTAAGCEDATAAFRTSGGSELVQRVCWEPTGHLRVESGLAPDAEPGSAGVRTMCTALSDFVTGSGKAWKGFTVYSTHRLSPGRAILTSSQPGQCARP
jgi:hypothetical protein